MNLTIRNHNARVLGMVLLFGILPFLILAAVGAIIPPQYDETYYGELPDLYEHLEQTEGPKIVVIGNSGTAFGIDSHLAEQLLAEAGIPYSVCKFGLYGSLGTRCMMELAKDSVEKGDLVILSPELFPQSLSMYFSAKEVWYAIEGMPKLLLKFPGELRSQLLEAYLPFVKEKTEQFLTGEKAKGSGIYAHASFDAEGNLTQYERAVNEMPGGTDENTPILLDASVFSSEFIDYLNAYGDALEKKGAHVYFGFGPMNQEAVTDRSKEQQDAFYEDLRELLAIPILGNLEDSLMEPEWFYDSNYHLNESGSVLYTVQLVNAVKNQLGNTTRTEVHLPEKPSISDQIPEEEGDNRDQDCFQYRLEENSLTVVGLSEMGEQAEELIIPCQVDGRYVTSLDSKAFTNQKKLRKVTIQSSLRSLPNACFAGCSSLEKIVLRHRKPAEISVGYELLKGAPEDCRIAVQEEALSEFANNYFWGRYAERLCKEEEQS